MALTIDRIGPKSFELGLVGKLEKDDYERFTPHAEGAIENYGEVSFLVQVPPQPRFTPSALWEDLKFTATHYGDVSRLAIVSQDESKEWLATIAKPFSKAEVRFFTADRIDDAREWVIGDGA